MSEPTSFGEQLNQMLRQEYDKIMADYGDRLLGDKEPEFKGLGALGVEFDKTPIRPKDDWSFDWRYGTLNVQKASAWVPISMELAIDSGLITEEEARAQGWTPLPPPPPVAWHKRLRQRLWWAQYRWRDKLGCLAYKLITGHEVQAWDE